MITKESRKNRVRRRHERLRKKISGTKDMPRLAVHKTNKHIYAQLINDAEGKTLVTASTLQTPLNKELKTTWNIEAAKKVGEILAKRAMDKGIKSIVFDRGGNRYHGKILAFAEAVRANGLKF